MKLDMLQSLALNGILQAANTRQAVIDKLVAENDKIKDIQLKKFCQSIGQEWNGELTIIKWDEEGYPDEITLPPKMEELSRILSGGPNGILHSEPG